MSGQVDRLGVGVVIKADNDWRGVGRPQVALAVATWRSGSETAEVAMSS